ncbi:MAG: FadR/GntR family transcriptional regulator [Chloroflexota bacterium]
MIETSPLAAPAAGHRVEQVAEALKRYILTNRLAPGTQLPTERQLASALVVGRNLVREALNSLVALGMIEKRQGSGIYVREFNADGLAEQLSFGLGDEMAYWEHLFEARVEIEVMLAPLAARRMTDVRLAQIRTDFDRMRLRVERGESLAEEDLALHRQLVNCAGNPVLERLARAVISEYFRCSAVLRLGVALVGDLQTIANHAPLLAALTDRDPVASAAAMRYHFHTSRASLHAVLEGGTTCDATEPR